MTPVDFFRVGIFDNFDVMRTRSDARRSGNAQTKGQVLVHGASRAAARLCFVAPRISADIIFKADMPNATCLDPDSPRFS